MQALFGETFNEKTQKSMISHGQEGKFLPDLSLDLEMKAGVGGIGRSRVETYSLDYSIFSKL